MDSLLYACTSTWLYSIAGFCRLACYTAALEAEKAPSLLGFLQLSPFGQEPCHVCQASQHLLTVCQLRAPVPSGSKSQHDGMLVGGGSGGE